MAFQIDDRVADQLARAVEGDVTTSLDLEEIDPLLHQRVSGGEQVAGLRRATQRDDRWMLDEEQHILGDLSRDAGASNAALQIERFGIRDEPQAFNQQLRHAIRRAMATRESSCRASRAPLLQRPPT